MTQELKEDDRHKRRDVDHADAGYDPPQRREDGLRDLVQQLDQRVVRVLDEPGEDGPQEDGYRQDLHQDQDERTDGADLSTLLPSSPSRRWR
jgi:hypothetical protein